MSILTTWFSQQFASLPFSLLSILFGAALLISTPGFYRVVYFISISYAFSIVAMSVIVVAALRQNLTWAAALQNLLLTIWGLRLGIFLVRRELQPAYGKELAGVHARTAGMALARKTIIWVGVSLLYIIMFTPSLFVLAPTPGASTTSNMGVLVQWLGLIVMAAALGVETLADQQKSAFKARHPSQFCNIHLYHWVRFPNYFGEILFWVGNWTAALFFYVSPLRWLLGSIGLLCIVLIMLGSSKRLEEQQDARYGWDPAYQNYVRTTPILVPFVPVYTLHNLSVYLG
jgi:steroid 5-alpha reductase family enzyme